MSLLILYRFLCLCICDVLLCDWHARNTKNSLEESRMRDIVNEEVKAVLQAELTAAFCDLHHRLDKMMSDFNKN